MSNKHQVPVLGGLRKVIRTGENVTPGTTIAEIGDQTITLAQLAALIGAIQAQNTNPGTPVASIALGPGLSGGGPVVGVVPIRLDTLPSVIFDSGGGSDSGSGTDGFMIPGPAGARGAQGQPAFYIPDDGEDAPWIPGQQGPQGVQGIRGETGLEGDAGEDALMIPGIQGPQGIQGIPGTGGTGSGIGPPGQDGNDGEDAMMIPGSTGIQGPPGAQGLIGQSIPGATGDDGEDGLWIPGNPGPQGLQGLTGASVPGFTGDDGEEAPWIPGQTGPRGLQGVQGATGIEGDTGEDALMIPGVAGAQGLLGTVGPQGLEGDAGEDPLMIPGPPGSTTGGSGTPSAPVNSVQFNNAGAFGGSANFTYASGTVNIAQSGAASSMILTQSGAASALNIKMVGVSTAGVFVQADATGGAQTAEVSVAGNAGASGQRFAMQNDGSFNYLWGFGNVPTLFATNGVERGRILAGGGWTLANAGTTTASLICGTGSSGYSTFTGILTVGTSGGDYPFVGYNWVPTGAVGGATYAVTDFASRIQFKNGGVQLQTAASGTAAGAITFANTMTVNTSGTAVVITSASGSVDTLGLNAPSGTFTSLLFSNAGTLKAQIYWNNSTGRFRWLAPTNGFDMGTAGDIKYNASQTVAASAAINTVSTYISSAFSLPAGFLTAGQRFRIRVWGTCTTTVANTTTFTVRLGAAGTTADLNIASNIANTAGTTGTNIPFHLDIDVVIRVAGASGTTAVQGQLISTGTTGISNSVGGGVSPTVVTTAINMTGALFLGISFVSSAATTTCTFQSVSVNHVL